ncbi:hypothetical protein SNE40_010418 [Patella caerulea]|uniref:Transmembrane protein 242 n=1 Tax=Patella caerulea TaxID=87958 RepID=A0AAN8K1H7_PATCE
MSEIGDTDIPLGQEPNDKRLQKIKGGIFLASLTGLSLLGGFGLTIGMAKKQDPSMFSKGMATYQPGISESGGHLALRALGRASLYSVGGVGLFSLIVWKLSGAHNMQEFTTKVQSILPKIPKRESTGRSEFKTIRELFEYLIQEDGRKK